MLDHDAISTGYYWVKWRDEESDPFIIHVERLCLNSDAARISVMDDENPLFEIKDFRFLAPVEPYREA